jgi:cytochrome P450
MGLDPSHPEQLAMLKADASLIDGAVEEILRYQPQGTFGLPQIAAEDVELAGVRIQQGELVFAPSYCGNRDERRSSDSDRFDIMVSDAGRGLLIGSAQRSRRAPPPMRGRP